MEKASPERVIYIYTSSIKQELQKSQNHDQAIHAALHAKQWK